MTRRIRRRGKMRRRRSQQWQGGVENDGGRRQGEEGAKPHREGETTGQSQVGSALFFTSLYPISCKIATPKEQCTP